jgi:microcystin-dependent protein
MATPYLGNVPNRSTGAATFSADTDYYHSWLSGAIASWNIDIAALNTNDTRDTSATSVLLGTGSKSFTVSSGKSFVGGMYLIIADTAAPSTNSMFCQVTSYSGTALVVNVIAALGSGTKTAWTISLTAAGGAGRGANNDITSLGGLTTALSITQGGTAATTAAGARAALGVELEAGAVMPYARNTAPSGWLKANGALISRTTYATLFAAIGTTFGAGDGSTTFAVPDLRGEFLRGWDDGRGIDTGRVFGSAQTDDFKAHAHNWNVTYATSGAAGGAVNVIVGGTTAGTTNTGGTETRPRNIALLVCIKY